MSKLQVGLPGRERLQQQQERLLKVLRLVSIQRLINHEADLNGRIDATATLWLLASPRGKHVVVADATKAAHP